MTANNTTLTSSYTTSTLVYRAYYQPKLVVNRITTDHETVVATRLQCILGRGAEKRNVGHKCKKVESQRKIRRRPAANSGRKLHSGKVVLPSLF